MSDESKIDDGGHSLGQASSKWVEKLDPTLMASELTMRDWFAGMALQGLLASPYDFPPGEFEDHLQHGVKTSYAYADAMLAERKRVTP